MYSKEEKTRAVKLYIEYGLKATAAIRELGYPSRVQLASWYREWQDGGGGSHEHSLERYTTGQKKAAVRHCLTHGKCNALTRRELGYPKCASKLAEWIDEHAPGERRAAETRTFDTQEKAAAVEALVSRETSAQEVADKVGCTRSVLYKWERGLLQGEGPAMPEDDAKKLAQPRKKPAAAPADIDALEAKKAGLENELRPKTWTAK